MAEHGDRGNGHELWEKSRCVLGTSAERRREEQREYWRRARTERIFKNV